MGGKDQVLLRSASRSFGGMFFFPTLVDSSDENMGFLDDPWIYILCQYGAINQILVL